MSPQLSKISPHLSGTFSEYILLPRKTEPGQSFSDISLASSVATGFPLEIPFMSAAMESVTGEALAIALALEGGLGVVPAGRLDVDEQLRLIRAVKSFQDGFQRDFVSARLSSKILDVEALVARWGYSSFPVLDDDGCLLGEISNSDYHPAQDLELRVENKMKPLEELQVFHGDESRAKVTEGVLSSKVRRAYLVDEAGKLRELVFRKGLSRELRFNRALRDSQGQLKVAAAVSTHPEDRERARACVEAGADLLSIDASDGFSVYMEQTLEELRDLGVPIVAGNVVCAEGFRFLATHGASAVKIGIGSGSICTTRRVKAIGRGQATALLEVAQARDAWFEQTGVYLPLVSDGGLSGTGNMAVALAMGADVLMMGKFFAAFNESPTEPYLKKFSVSSGTKELEVSVKVKPYWGEASARAKNVRRYEQTDPRTFVIEGEEGYVVSTGSIHDKLPGNLKAIKGTLSSCGCSTLADFRSNVVLERQSSGSQNEGGTSILQG